MTVLFHKYCARTMFVREPFGPSYVCDIFQSPSRSVAIQLLISRFGETYIPKYKVLQVLEYGRVGQSVLEPYRRARAYYVYSRCGRRFIYSRLSLS